MLLLWVWSAYWTCRIACTAIYTDISIDFIMSCTLADSLYRTSGSTGSTTDAIVANYICHISSPPYDICPIINLLYENFN
jgi:hypothetical protein